MILLWRPKSCCWRAVFSPFNAVICCWILLFSAFWKLKCLFLKLWNLYIYSSILTSSFDKLFFTSAVFIVSTDSKVSFSLLRICTSFLWLFSSLEMFFICCWLSQKVPREFGAFPWGRQGSSWSSVQFHCSWSYRLFDLPSKKFNKKYKHSHKVKSWNHLFDIYLTTSKMSYEMALRKAGLPIVRSFLHSI